MDNSSTLMYQGILLSAHEFASTDDILTVEEALRINVNREAFTITMRTPGNDLSLVRGLLHSEGVISKIDNQPTIELSWDDDNSMMVAEVDIASEHLNQHFTNSRSLLSVASCGVCGKTELDNLLLCDAPLQEGNQVAVNDILLMFDLMREVQHDFERSGGSHASAAFTAESRLIAFAEDIGRHNAVDKVIGQLINEKNYRKATVLTVSGRISYEIVAKCFKARIPILAAVSAPSSLAVDFAKELGITLIAFCRNRTMTCYANPQRINTNKLNTQAANNGEKFK